MSSLSSLFFRSLFFIKSNLGQLLKGWGSKIFFINRNRKFVLVQYNPSVLIFILLNRVFGVGV
ncbi:hypothetical protein QAD60_03130 [Helicobacter pylori]|uniref:hypothetical protein n=1 Tax=Helicobacter pylori TaxID=210 RepID=UPI0025753F54|nr:hypothetical protein [Helicobacter pylori]MDO8146255.1 hypothetical protein [Helicobacter pylori]WJJ00787.1 hypothetical protein QAP01_05115 [Helicobacter pylori]